MPRETLTNQGRKMQRPARATLAVASLLGLAGWASLSGCGWAQLRAENEALKQRNVASEQKLAQLELKLLGLSAHLENVERALWSDKYCENPKNVRYKGQISEFLGQVQAHVPGICTTESLQAALIYLNNEPYMVAIFRPNGLVKDIHLSRLGYLKTKLFAPKYIHPSTRLLVVVQPAEETEASQRQALKMGEDYVQLLNKKFFLEGGPRILGPHLLPCRLTSDISRIYKGDMDSPLPTEPRDGTPQVRIWTFRSDC